MRRSATAQTSEALLVEARVLGRSLTGAMAKGDIAAVAELANEYAALLSARVTVIDSQGEVLVETDQDPAEMGNHLYRPEVQQAEATGSGTSIRASDTLGVDMIYAAVRVEAEGKTLGYVRAAIPERDLSDQLRVFGRTLLLVAVVAIIAAIALAVAIAETIARPIRRLSSFVRRLARGDLDQRLISTSVDEIGQLATDTMEMAQHLRDTISTLSTERSRLEAVLDNMTDAVIIADRQGVVSLVNPAALTMLRISHEAAVGRSLTQVVRQHEISNLWSACVTSGESQSEVVDLGDQLLQVTASPLEAMEPGACLLVLQDVTRIRRLEGMRREFVSSASHELRTPLASLRAIVDTLRDGAIDDRPAAERFISRMDGEIDALTQMVEELLELSRIESGEVPIQMTGIPVASFVLPPLERLRPQIERARLSLKVSLDESLPLVLGDTERLQQVVTNLVHNAIKFTPEGGTISLWAEHIADHVTVSISDTGIGIPDELQARVFERFFKADRSRSTGGTGLGLAIAKHIVRAHGGRIWVTSTEGQGSTFSFTLLVATADSLDAQHPA